jgi:hypothetical protein
VFAVISCNSDSFELHDVGDNLVKPSTNVIITDTVSIKASTVIKDSIQTQSSGQLIIGRYEDPYIGDIKATTYTRLAYMGTSSISSIDDETIIDSVVFVASIGTRYYGDTLKTAHFGFHTITEDMDPNDNSLKEGDVTYKNIDKLPYKADPSFSFSIDVKPNRKNYAGTAAYEYRFPIDKSFADPFIEEALIENGFVTPSRETIFTKSTLWKEKLKGFAIVPKDDDNSCIFNFLNDANSSARIIIYYRGNDTFYDDGVKYRTLELKFNPSISFSNFEIENPKNNIDKLSDQKVDVSTTETNNLAFIQNGVGLSTKLVFPYLSSYRDVGTSNTVLKAELLVYPLEDSFNDETHLPTNVSLAFSQLNEDNIVVGSVVDGSSTAIRGAWVYDKFTESESYISYDITNYVTQQIYKENQSVETDGLEISFTDALNLERLILDNRKDSDRRIKLKLVLAAQN